MLGGLDGVAWNELTGASGSVEHVPDLVRKAAGEDDDVAAAALSELFGHIFHQRTVYPVTVAVVPFLAELARQAPRRRAEVVWILGRLADSRHAEGAAFPQVSAAVAGQADVFVALLDDADARVREAAAYAVAVAGAPAEPLWRRWRVEDDPAVRASLALALGQTAAAAGSALAETAVHAPPVVRAAAAVALLRAGQAWPGGGIPALVDAIDAGAEIAYGWTTGPDWYTELLEAPPTDVAVRLLGQMLRSGNPQTRTAGIWAASARCEVRRSAPPAVVPMLVPVLDDPDPSVHAAAMRAVSQAGRAAGEFADVLAGIAARLPQVVHERDTMEYQAVRTLQRLGDPRWIEPVCAAVAAGHPNYLLGSARYTPEVLAAIRDRLRTDPTRAYALAGVLAKWGAHAHPAVPELLAALPNAEDEVVSALLKLGHDDPAMLPHLREHKSRIAALRPAMSIWRMTGDPQPVLDTLLAVLSHNESIVATGAIPFTDLGEALAPLLPAAQPYLTGTAAPYPNGEVQILAARVMAAVTGPEPVIATLHAVLVAGERAASDAAELVADLAQTHPAAVAHLEPELRNLLGNRYARRAAARALGRLGVPTAELAEALVQELDTDTIVELRAVETIPALEQLLASDERLPMPIIGDNVVWIDELLQDRLHATIRTLTS